MKKLNFLSQINVDGSLVATVSSGRESALIKDVNMEIPHHFAVSIVPLHSEKSSKTFLRNLMFLEPATYFHQPCVNH